MAHTDLLVGSTLSSSSIMMQLGHDASDSTMRSLKRGTMSCKAWRARAHAQVVCCQPACILR